MRTATEIANNRAGAGMDLPGKARKNEFNQMLQRTSR